MNRTCITSELSKVHDQEFEILGILNNPKLSSLHRTIDLQTW